MKQGEDEEIEKLWRRASSPRKIPDKDYVIKTKVKDSNEGKVEKQMFKVAFLGKGGV